LVSCGVWRRQAPGLFRTELIQGLVSFGVAEGSAYRKTLEGLRAENTAYIAGAGNPAEVADAIEQCIRADDPPARVVVGEDAQKWVKLVHDADPDSFAKLLRAEVATLADP
jgi:NAD(P)-dependent dehydrogenase (short-subunit alcohol dehydrogenase family)